MGDRHQIDRLDRDSRLYETYVENARELLASDERFRAAREEWTTFVTTSHGDVFADLPLSAPETDLFVDSLYYDFVVDQLIGVVERSTGVTVANPDPGANTDALAVSFRSLHDRVVDADPDVDTDAVAEPFDRNDATADLQEEPTAFLRSLYESVVSRAVRLALGEYYTPRGVAELAVEAMDVADTREATFLDPGCGSGVFLAVCIDRKVAAMGEDHDPDAILDAVTSSVAGIDLNPVAVKSAKLAYLLSVLPVLDAAETDTVELPVFLADALGLTRDASITFRGESFDPTVSHLVGNPPWITWDRLSDRIKDRWRERYADELDLLPHDGAAARLGYANDDVSLPYVWVCVDRYLQEGGQASFVLKRDVLTGPAGKLLRTLRVGDRPLSVAHVHDFGTLRPFGDQVGANAAVYTLAADATPEFPIDTTAWTRSRSDQPPDFSTAGSIRETLTATRTGLVPLNEDDSASAWIRTDAERAAIGDCAHEIRHGVKDDAQDVFSIDRDQLGALEPDLVYPYLKSRHVVKYGLFGHELRLVPLRTAHEDNEAELRAQYPETYRYLANHRDRLEARSSSWLDQGPFYTVFGLGEYTWADYKVVWCRLGFKPHFAVVSTVDDPDLGEKTVVPGDHCMFVATDDRREAHFLCALLNSAPYQRSLRDLASEGKASLSKSVVSQLAIPEWAGTDRQRRLADLSMDAHEVVPRHTDTSKRAYNATTIDELEEIQGAIDRTAEAMLADRG